MKIFNTWPLSYRCDTITTTTELGNMAFQIGNSREDVIANRNKLAEELNIPLEKFVFVHQSHSDVIKEVGPNVLGAGEKSFESGIEADALYTKETGVPLGIFHADCEPIFFVDETVPLVGIIHAGFKGTMKHIAYKAVKEVCEKENLNPENIKVFVGPCRREKSFEVDKASIREIKQAKFNKCVANSHFRLSLANELDLQKAGILKANIQDSLVDTVTDELCYSAYKKEPVGRMASFIILK